MATKKEKERNEVVAELYRLEMAQAAQAQQRTNGHTNGTTAAKSMAAMGAAEAMARGPHTAVANRTRGSMLRAEKDDFGDLGAATDNNLEVAFSGGTRAVPMQDVDESLLLDAWYAEYSDPATRAILRHQPVIIRSVQEVVIGDDDRVQVTGITQNYPWRCIASLRITAADGSMWIGTGWLVGPRILLTAGHCVYIHDRGGWVSQIEVIPGRDGAQQPFGSAIATSFRSVLGWTQDNNREFDYAAILLPAENAYGNQLGWFGYAVYDNTALDHRTVNLSGYPGDKPAGTQWFHSRQLTAVSERVITYDIDTAGGQSGAPVWVLENGSRYGVGVHTNGHIGGNSATRITQEVFDNISAWRAETETEAEMIVA